MRYFRGCARLRNAPDTDNNITAHLTRKAARQFAFELTGMAPHLSPRERIQWARLSI
jgi:hypothetical protein